MSKMGSRTSALL